MHERRHILRSGLALLVALCALSAPRSSAPQGPRVEARLSAGVLRLGDQGEVLITLEGADGARVLGLPSVPGLRFGEVRFKGQQSYTQFRGGRVQTETTLSYSIPFRPEAVGDYEIPPLELEAAGTRLKTKALRLTVAEDLEGADFGYLEVTPSSPVVVEGQPFTVQIALGWDAREEVAFAELNLPWWDALPGALELESPPPPAQSRVDGIQVNGQRVAATQAPSVTRSGREFVRLVLEKTYLPTRSAALEFPTSFFEFGRDRRLSIFNSRRESHFVKAEPFRVEVVPLPSEGQPRDFTGAVGKLTFKSSVDARDVRVGDSIKLTLEWGGQGNLQFFSAPDLAALDAFRGFRFFGQTEDKSAERRQVVYDLTPLSTDVKEIPALSFPTFDPAARSYSRLASAAIPIRVRALEKSATLADAEKSFERDLEDIEVRPLELSSDADARKDTFLAVALLGVPLLGLAARARVRRLHGDPDAPAARRRRRARRTLARALERSGSAREDLAAFLEFLGAESGERGEAWSGRDVPRWNAARAGALAPERARALAELLTRLEAAVYGGGARVARAELEHAASGLAGGLR